MGSVIKWMDAAVSHLVVRYREYPIQLQRKIFYNMVVLWISLLASGMYLLNILILPGQSQESPVFFMVLLGVLVLNVFALSKGLHWAPIVSYSLVLLQSHLNYFPGVAPGNDALLIGMFSFITAVWLLISFKWWHWMMHIANVAAVVVVRLMVNGRASVAGALAPNAFLSVLNAYGLLVAVVGLSCVLYYLIEREQTLSHKEVALLETRERMYQELVESINCAECHDTTGTKRYLEAYFDPGTGCMNKLAFNHFFMDIRHEERYPNGFSIVFMDLDGLKRVNDTWGHAQGDVYLQTFVRLLKDGKAPEDTLYRIGGDEFILIAIGKGIADIQPVI